MENLHYFLFTLQRHYPSNKIRVILKCVKTLIDYSFVNENGDTRILVKDLDRIENQYGSRIVYQARSYIRDVLKYPADED